MIDNCDRGHILPLVSVIMPVYNAEAFVKEAISSVLLQTMTDWELIVIDDESKDNTIKIVSDFAKKDARIHLIVNETNLGVAKTRNRGLDIFRGKYVAFLDSDDYWKPEMLEKMLDCAVKTNADIVYCSYELVDENGKKICKDFIVPPETSFKKSLVRNVISCSTTLITSEIAKNNRFPTNMYHEDIALWFQILRDGGTAQGVTEVLAAYRQRSNSRSSEKLASARRRWTVYRKHLKLPLLQSFFALVRYGYYGVIKYRKIAGGE